MEGHTFLMGVNKITFVHLVVEPCYIFKVKSTLVKSA